MTQIVIEEVKIRNFGPFFGTHRFQLGPVGDRTAVLIGGYTGAGKTHFLRALYLAVDGHTAIDDLRKMDGETGTARFDISTALNRRA